MSQKLIFSGLIYFHCAMWADYETKPALNKNPFSTSNEFHQIAEQGEKNPNIHLYSQRVYLVLELQPNTVRPREASTIPGNVFIIAANLQVSRKGGGHNWASSNLQWLWFHALCCISMVAETYSSQPPPLFFHCPTIFLLNVSPQTGGNWPSYSGGWTSPTWDAKRFGIGFHYRMRAFIHQHVPLMCFDPQGKIPII